MLSECTPGMYPRNVPISVVLVGRCGGKGAVGALDREQALLALLAWIGQRILAHHLDRRVGGQAGRRLVSKLEGVARRRLEQAASRAKGEVGECANLAPTMASQMPAS
eukprot:4064218-Prymnesium_polylepis.1